MVSRRPKPPVPQPKPVWVSLPAIQCRVLKIPAGFSFHWSSFEPFDGLFVSSEGEPIRKIEFVETPPEQSTPYLNKTEWKKESVHSFSFTTVGLYSSYGKYSLRINGKKTIVFEIVPAK